MSVTDPSVVDLTGSEPAEDLRSASWVGRVLRQGGWTAIGYGLTAGVGLAISVIAARRLGPGGFGAYSYFIWVMRLVAIVGALGIPYAMSKFLPEFLGANDASRAKASFRWVLRIHLAFTPVLFAITAAIGWSKDGLLVGVSLGSSVVLLSVVFSLDGAISGLRRFRWLARNATVVSIAHISMVGVAAALGGGWRVFLLVQAAASVIALGVSLGSVRAGLQGGIAPRLEPEVRRKIVRFIGAMGIYPLIEMVLWGRPELFFLERWGGTEEVGLYSVAVVLATPVSLVPLLVNRALIPEFSNLLGGSEGAALRRAFPMLCSYIGLFAIPAGIGGALVSRELILTAYGEAYGGAATATSLVMVGSIFLALVGPAAAATVTGPRPFALTAITGSFAILNLALDAALIPHFGIIGAATASISSQVLAIAAIAAHARKLGLVYPLATLAKITAAALAAGVAGWLAARPLTGLAAVLVAVGVAAPLYAGLVRLGKIVGWREMKSVARARAQLGDAAEAAAP